MSGWARVWTAHSRAGRCSVSPRRSARGRTSALCCRPHGTAVLLRCRGRGSQLPIARPAFVVWCWWTRSATAASRRRHPPLLVDQDEHPFGLIDDCPVVCNFCDSGSYESCCSALQWCRQRESYATCWIKSLPASGAIRVAGETERCRNHQLLRIVLRCATPQQPRGRRLGGPRATGGVGAGADLLTRGVASASPHDGDAVPNLTDTRRVPAPKR